jgi:hypothetical protein
MKYRLFETRSRLGVVESVNPVQPSIKPDLGIRALGAYSSNVSPEVVIRLARRESFSPVAGSRTESRNHGDSRGAGRFENEEKRNLDWQI